MADLIDRVHTPACIDYLMEQLTGNTELPGHENRQKSHPNNSPDWARTMRPRHWQRCLR